MINTLNQPRKARGFTIVELMLATSVFSIILLAALASFLQIGRLFYKGVSLTNTQNVATTVLNDISNSMQNADTVSTNPDGSGKPIASNGYDYFCIGNTRYTYTTHSYNGQQVSNVANSSAGTFGLLKDNGCAAPCASGCGGAGFDQTNPVEMLGDQMRLASITITNVPTAQNLYNIKMVVAYGDDTVLSFSDLSLPACTGGSANQAYCSVVSLSTTVFKGIRL